MNSVAQCSAVASLRLVYLFVSEKRSNFDEILAPLKTPLNRPPPLTFLLNFLLNLLRNFVLNLRLNFLPNPPLNLKTEDTRA